MTTYPLWLKGLTPELRKYAEETLGETPQVRKTALEEFRLLIQERPDIYSREDDLFLLRFLRAKKFDVERAFKTFCNYHHVMTKYRGVFTGKTPSEMRNTIEMNSIMFAPLRIPPCSPVCFFRFDTFDLERLTAEDYVAMQFIFGELVFDCEATHLCGGVYIMDLGGMTLKHYVQFVKPSLLMLIISILQDCWPQRVTGVHFVNEPMMLHALLSAFKPFLNKKFKERIHFHGKDLNSLHQHVSKKFLPEELGGSMGPFDNSEFASYVFSQEAHFQKNKEYGIKKA